MAMCPQCGLGLGEGAKGCASCGWKSSSRNVIVILLVVFGILALLCGGMLVWLGIQAKKGLEVFAEHGTPVGLLAQKVRVLQYAREKGSLPKTLGEAADATDEDEESALEVNDEQGRRFLDGWFQAVRYTAREDGTFEIRSGGPDKQMDTADDVVANGTVGEDIAAARAELRRRKKELGKSFQEKFGGKNSNVRITVDDGEDGPESDTEPDGKPAGEATEDGTKPEENGKKPAGGDGK